MKLSIIIITRNRADMLKSCLNSLVTQTKKSDEVIVVDNSSNDNTKNVVINFNKQLPIRYIFEPRIGIPIARNTGIKNAKYDIIAFIDDDCVADKNWIKNLHIIHKKNSDILIIQGKINNKLKNKLLGEAFQYLLNNCDPAPFDTKNLSFKRKILNNLKYVFDEKFIFGEDAELGVRLRQKRYKILHSPNIVVYHDHRTDFISFAKQQFISGKYAYLLKQKYKKDLRYLPKDLQNIYFLLGSLFIMPFTHTFKSIKVVGLKSAIKFLPIIFFQKLFRYFGFISGRIIFDNNKK